MQVVCIKIVWVLVFAGVLPPGQPVTGGVFSTKENCETLWQIAASNGANWQHTCVKETVQ